MAFPCPSCGGHNTRVSNTEQKGYRIKRYIRCEGCGVRYRTVEQLAEAFPGGRRKVPLVNPDGVNHGEANPAAVLTQQNVRDIRHALAAGESQRSVARRYGVSPSHVCRIARRQIWRNV